MCLRSFSFRFEKNSLLWNLTTLSLIKRFDSNLLSLSCWNLSLAFLISRKKSLKGCLVCLRVASLLKPFALDHWSLCTPLQCHNTLCAIIFRPTVQSLVSHRYTFFLCQQSLMQLVGHLRLVLFHDISTTLSRLPSFSPASEVLCLAEVKHLLIIGCKISEVNYVLNIAEVWPLQIATHIEFSRLVKALIARTHITPFRRASDFWGFSLRKFFIILINFLCNCAANS